MVIAVSVLLLTLVNDLNGVMKCIFSLFVSF